MAAGLLFVQEAGGKFGSIDGDDSPLKSGTLICANMELYPVLLEKLRLAK